MLVERYDKVLYQRNREDIINELKDLEGDTKGGHRVHLSKNRDGLGEEYGLSGRSVARLLRVNELVPELKEKLDKGKLSLMAAVDLSFLTEEEQQMVYGMIHQKKLKMKPKMAAELRKQTGKLAERVLAEILDASTVNKSSKDGMVSLRIPNTVCEKYLEGFSAEQMTAVVEQALAAWFESVKGASHV